jgi:hypothetical protein
MSAKIPITIVSHTSTGTPVYDTGARITDMYVTGYDSYGAAYMPKDAILSSTLLFTLNKQGRNVLAYIIDRTIGDDQVTLNNVDMINYLSDFVPSSQANTVNIKRGIKNLIKNQVLVKTDSPDTYLFSKSLFQRAVQSVKSNQDGGTGNQF